MLPKTLEALVCVVFENEAEMNGSTSRTDRILAAKHFGTEVCFIGGRSFWASNWRGRVPSWRASLFVERGRITLTVTFAVRLSWDQPFRKDERLGC